MPAMIDNMAYVGETPWHGLGVKLDQGKSLDQWMKAAGLNWDAKLTPVLYDADGNGEAVEQMPGQNVLYRSDNGKALSIVSERYKPVQPKEVFKFFKKYTEDLEICKMETAGSLDEGRKIWALAKAEDEFTLGGEDKIGRYLLLATSYDRSLPTLVSQTSIRVVCHNTLMLAAESDVKSQHRISHITEFSADKAQQLLELNTNWQSFSAIVKKLAARKVTSDKGIEYFTNVFYPMATSESTPIKTITRRIDQLQDIYETAPGQEMASARGRAWGYLNAVTRFVDFDARSRDQDRRLDKAWFGEGAVIKQRAFELAQEL
jgi:phage/plasmid-like protein (TIGR03299 family)